MLIFRWNKDGRKISCDSSQLDIMKENGYKFDKCPEIKQKVNTKTNSKTKPKEKVSEKSETKIVEKVEIKKEISSTPDIIL